jgi:hypothetical protein
MLSVREIALLCAILAPTSLIAVAAWFRYPRVWWMSLCALATAAGIVLYLPIRTAFDPPGEIFGFLIVFEFLIFGSLLGVVHMASILAIVLLVVGEINEERKREAARKTP